MNKELLFKLFLSVLVVVLLSGCAERRIESQLRKAEELKGIGNYAEALESYKVIIDKYSSEDLSANAYLKMGELLQYTLNNIDEAMKAYADLEKKWPLTEAACEAAVNRALILRNKGDFRGAILNYERALKRFPDYEGRFRIKLSLAEEYLNLNDPFQASKELEELLSYEGVKDDVKSKAMLDLGESYLFLGSYEKAFQVFAQYQKVYAGSPNVLDAELKMIECLEKMEREGEALVLLKSLGTKYPDSELVKNKLASLIKRGEKVDKPELNTGE